MLIRPRTAFTTERPKGEMHKYQSTAGKDKLRQGMVHAWKKTGWGAASEVLRCRGEDKVKSLLPSYG